MPHPMTPPGGGGRKGNSGAVGLLTSLAVFAVICGLILLFAGGSWGGSDADSPEVARHKRIVKASRGAAKAGQQAKAALCVPRIATYHGRLNRCLSAVMRQSGTPDINI